jgi:hypothetical protein
MAISDQFKFFIGVLEDGQIEYRKTRVLTDGPDVFEKHFRQVLEPGQDVTSFPAKLRQICAVVWTPAVIAAYLAAKAAREAAQTP